MHIEYICTDIFVQFFHFFRLIYLSRYIIILIENKNTAVVERYQHSTTRAGAHTTYTTGHPAPMGIVYPFPPIGAR